MTVSRWFWPGVASAAAVLSVCAVRYARPESQRFELPEISVESQIYADELHTPVQLHEAENSADETTSVPLPETEYTVRLRDNTLFVYAAGAREPVGSYDLPADWLPQYDRVILEYGIRVTGEDALRQVLEDYVS